MKNLFGLSLIVMLSLSLSCNRDQDLEREEEIDRGDLIEENYDQDDFNSGGELDIDSPVSEE